MTVVASMVRLAPAASSDDISPPPVTVSAALPDLPLKLAEILTVPATRPLANPALLTVAFDVSSLAQVAVLLMSAVVASE